MRFLGSGTWFGLPITKNVIESMGCLSLRQADFVLGVLIAVINILTKYKISKEDWLRWL